MENRREEICAGDLLYEMQEVDKLILDTDSKELLSSHTAECSMFLTIYCC